MMNGDEDDDYAAIMIVLMISILVRMVIMK